MTVSLKTPIGSLLKAGCLLTALLSTAVASVDIPLTAEDPAVIDILKGRDVSENLTVGRLGDFSLKPSSDARGETLLTLTVYADSGLPRAYLESLAAETRALQTLPVRILFKGLPMTRRPDGLMTADRAEIAERLSPLLEAGIPSAVDPRAFHEVSTALDRFEKKEPLAGFTAPAVLVTIEGPDRPEARHELVIGTLSPVRALQEVAVRSPSRLMRRDLRNALAGRGLSGLIDGIAGDTPDRRPGVRPPAGGR